MPIDLKTVRAAPDTVKQWHAFRNIDETIVDECLRLDGACRQLVAQLDQSRQRLRSLQATLRPAKSRKGQENAGDMSEATPLDKDRVKSDIRQLQTEIATLQKEQQQAKRAVQEASYQVASSIDTKLFETFPPTTNNRPSNENLQDIDCTSNSGLEISHAAFQFTLRHFAHYPLQKVGTQTLKQDSVDSDKRRNNSHALWGCRKGGSGATCEVCDNPEMVLPSWLEFLSEAHRQNTKTIYGAKQLPQYACLWRTSDITNVYSDSLDIVALAPGSLWDSRNVQQSLLKEILDYLSNFDTLLQTDSTLQVHSAKPEMLNMHEISRLDIKSSDTGMTLASVSNYGDACSRACVMEFAGGGSRTNNIKEYVHVIHAKLVCTETIQWIIQHNRQQDKVIIPPCIIPFMIRPLLQSDTQNVASIPRKDLTNHSKAAFSSKDGRYSTQKTKMVVLGDFPVTKEQRSLEELSCPFEFLFGA